MMQEFSEADYKGITKLGLSVFSFCTYDAVQVTSPFLYVSEIPHALV